MFFSYNCTYSVVESATVPGEIPKSVKNPQSLNGHPHDGQTSLSRPQMINNISDDHR